MPAFKDAGHLFRVAAVFLLGVVSFLGIRSLLVPQSFGRYGHFRGNALQEISALPVHYAGHQACESCHSDIVEKKNAGKHARVNCEACHGPLSSHADDPSEQPAKLDTAVLCAKCHEANAAKPRNFPQVKTEDHSSGLPCDTCHQPHSPAIAAEIKNEVKK